MRRHVCRTGETLSLPVSWHFLQGIKASQMHELSMPSYQKQTTLLQKSKFPKYASSEFEALPSHDHRITPQQPSPLWIKLPRNKASEGVGTLPSGRIFQSRTEDQAGSLSRPFADTQQSTTSPTVGLACSFLVFVRNEKCYRTKLVSSVFACCCLARQLWWLACWGTFHRTQHVLPKIITF